MVILLLVTAFGSVYGDIGDVYCLELIIECSKKMTLTILSSPYTALGLNMSSWASSRLVSHAPCHLR
jgi:hypothetical protein